MSNAILFSPDFSALPREGLLVVGYSGGADSTALAHSLLQEMGPERIVLAHVNHLLRGEEAERDEAFAREFARSRGLRFALFRADVQALAKEERLGLEECGRKVRYEFFESLAVGEDDRILTAHNADDNAETLLLNLTRGASLRGLCGIPRKRGKVLRPLLAVSREAIEEYCKANHLAYVTDSTNLSDDYTRNRLRHLVIPALKAINPQFLQAASRTMSQLSEQERYLEAEAEKLLEGAKIQTWLNRKMLRDAPRPIACEALKLYSARLGCGMLEQRHMEELICLLERPGSVDLPGKRFAESGQNWFSIGERKDSSPFFLAVSEGETMLPNGKIMILEKKIRPNGEIGGKINNLLFKNCLDYDTITEALFARTRKEGDVFAPAGRGVTKSLKQLFQEAGIPVSRRSGQVLLVCGETPAFCEGIGPSEPFCAGEKTKTFLTVTIRDASGEKREALPQEGEKACDAGDGRGKHAFLGKEKA